MAQKLLATAHVLHLKEDAAAGSPRGTRWHVRVIDAGLAMSGVDYPLQVLHEAAPVFEGVQVIARSDENHVEGRDTDPNKVVGWVRNVRASPEGLDADLELLEASDGMLEKLVEAWDRGKKDLLGLSIVAEGRARVVRDAKGTRQVATKITRARSVDVVVHAAAGGGLLDLVAAEGGSPGGVSMFDQVLKFLEAEHPDLFKAIKGRIDAGETVTEDDLLKAMQEGTTALREADTNKAGGKPASPKPAQAPAATVADDAMAGTIVSLTEAVTGLQEFVKAQKDRDDSAVHMTAAREVAKLAQFVEARLANVQPAVADMVREDLPADFKESDVDDLLAKHSRRAARLLGFDSPVAEDVAADGTRTARVVMNEGERIRLAMDGFFAEADQEHPATKKKVARFTSLRTMYAELTGDSGVSGDFREADRVVTNFRGMNNPDLWEKYPGERAFAEAVTTSTWASVFADTLRRSLVREYQENPQQQWRLLADIVPTQDFRVRHAMRMGGYGKLGTIAEDGAYDAFTSHTDDESTYTPVKYGGTDYVSREAILNDDVGAVRRIPRQMAIAAAYTLNWFVTNALFADNPNMTGTDVTALFVAGHANFATTAISATAVAAARLAMRKQTIAGVDADATWDSATTRRINVQPRYLWVPSDLEQTAFEITTPQSAMQVTDSTVPSYVRSLGLQTVVVPHWTDVNNWFLSADRSTGPIIELGFVQGKEDPDIFVQDMPTVGAMFTNDRMTFKLRHEYGGAAVDYRLLYGSIVA